jgi:hypothetical protein
LDLDPITRHSSDLIGGARGLPLGITEVKVPTRDIGASGYRHLGYRNPQGRESRDFSSLEIVGTIWTVRLRRHVAEIERPISISTTEVLSGQKISVIGATKVPKS